MKVKNRSCIENPKTFQSITEEPKYQAKALIVATDTINSGGSCSGNYS